MSTNWTLFGEFYSNAKVAEALNDAGVGLGAFVGLNASRTGFLVWGDDQSRTTPNYSWKEIPDTPNPQDLAFAANKEEALSATATVNSHGDWILWGYTLDEG